MGPGATGLCDIALAECPTTPQGLGGDEGSHADGGTQALAPAWLTTSPHIPHPQELPNGSVATDPSPVPADTPSSWGQGSDTPQQGRTWLGAQEDPRTTTG